MNKRNVMKRLYEEVQGLRLLQGLDEDKYYDGVREDLEDMLKFVEKKYYDVCTSLSSEIFTSGSCGSLKGHFGCVDDRVKKILCLISEVLLNNSTRFWQGNIDFNGFDKTRKDWLSFEKDVLYFYDVVTDNCGTEELLDDYYGDMTYQDFNEMLSKGLTSFVRNYESNKVVEG